MKSREIEQQSWASFLDHFSEQHRGDSVCMQVSGLESGVHTEACDMPLMGISDDFKASGGERIEVMAGDSTSRNITHAVLHPAHVRLAEDEDGRPVAMQIESQNGEKTLIRFGKEIIPMPDGTFVC